MPRVDIEILVNSCYVAELKIEKLANQNPEKLQTLTESVENQVKAHKS